MINSGGNLMAKEISLSVQKPRGGVFTPLGLVPDIQIIFVGAAACTRHRANEMGQMMKSSRMSVMCLDEVDFITGGYIDKIKDAVRGIYEQRNAKGVIILPNCQSALLSTDYGIITKELSEELGIPVKVREGCHICGFEAESDSDDSGNTEQLIYGFLSPKERDEETSVNIISVNPLSEDCEIYEVLRKAGVTKINELKNIKTFDEYQAMAGAHLNIMCNDNGDNLGKSLEAQLGIPYVTISGVYDPAELNRRYAEIGRILGADIDLSDEAQELESRFERLLPKLSDVSVTVSGAYDVCRWLIENGIKVGNIAVNPHIPMNDELAAWIKEHSPETVIGGGRGGYGGHGGRPQGGRPNGMGGGRPQGGYGGRPGAGGKGGFGGHGGGHGFGASTLNVGYVAIRNVIKSLEEAAEGGYDR